MAAKLIGAGLTTAGLSGAGIGIGLVFSAYMLAISKNPNISSNLFPTLLLGFALIEATALFSVLIGLIILFAF